MGLTDLLSRYAVRRAHVLVVEVPGAWVLRAHLERELVERGWRRALSSADADVLAVCGAPGPAMRELIDRLWEQMPGPRVRIDAFDVSAVHSALDASAEQLGDTNRHRRDVEERPMEPRTASEHHEEMDHGDTDHDSHQDMDHGDMEMTPDGISLAEGEDDRDGLEMDVLHLQLGPVLPHWPAGLVLRCTLQGDVITAAEGQLLKDRVPAAPVPEGTRQGWRWDNIARLLALAGWEAASARARVVRDVTLTPASTPMAGASPEELVRQVNRSRSLRWSLRGLRPLAVHDLPDPGLPEHLAGDTYDRFVAMLDRATRDAEEPPTVSPAGVAAAVVGLELAAARLVIASLDLPPQRVPEEAAHV